jgi:uncharacterized protein YndB with AHSA1/START domain
MSTRTSDREMTISRVINAPREPVFAAFSDAEHFTLWWGPNGFRTTVYTMDVRPGGSSRYTMHGPDGKDWPNTIEYLEVVAPEKLVYRHGAEEQLSDDPHCFHVTITFESVQGKTLVTLRSLFPTAEHLEAVKKFGAVEGGQQTLGRLDAYLSGHPKLYLD